MSDLRIVSVDDHVIEPPDLWQTRLPIRMRDSGPHVVPTRVASAKYRGTWIYDEVDLSDAGAHLADAWIYEDSRMLLPQGICSVGKDRDSLSQLPLSYERDIVPGAFEQRARLVDMDANDTEVSVCFPTVSRFCGQFFLGRRETDVALQCIRVYNDWMIDEWCAGDGLGRLIPVTLVPLWDVELAAEEVRRCANKGSHALSFSECPPFLGLPSLYSRYWDPLIAACDETDTIVNLHVGSSSRVSSTAEDMFHAVSSVLLWEYGMHAMLDWIMSGALERFSNVRIALNEVQAGWMPFILERADKVWLQNGAIDQAVDQIRDIVPNVPSSYIDGRVFTCVFDDLHGLKSRDIVGMEQILFETDYPHADSTWDHSMSTARQLAKDANLSDHEFRQFVRGNAISAFRLEEYFGIRP